MIKIHILHTGQVHVSPHLPFGGDKCNILKASGIIVPEKQWLWIPVSVYLIEHPKGLVLFDTGWSRDMSPNGVYDKKAQIKSLGGYMLYRTNQGVLPAGQSAYEQLKMMGTDVSDIDVILLSHLDCDHANGLKDVASANKILVSEEELLFAGKNTPVNKIRYHADWWKHTGIEPFAWNGTLGPAGKSYDVFGDGSIVMINIPGHSDGQCALKITGEDGRFCLLCADGGYAEKSWKQMIIPGISADKKLQKKSLDWIRLQSENEKYIGVFANHDALVQPGIIEV